MHTVIPSGPIRAKTSLLAPFAAIAAAFAPPVLCQSPVVVVTGSGSNLQTAIQNAADGTILRVQDGPYTSMTIDNKSLTIVEDAGHTVTIQAPLIVRNLASGQHVSVRGFAAIVDGSGGGHTIESNAGSVWIEDCTLSNGVALFGSPPPQSVRVEDSSAVVLARCDIGPDFIFGNDITGLVVDGSSVAAYECTIEGCTGGPQLDGGDGVRVTDAYLHLASCAVTGGRGGNGITLVHPVTGATLCTDGADGGDGIVVQGSISLVEHLATTFNPGAGGGAPGTCTAGAAGSASVVLSGTLTALPCSALDFEVSPSPAVGGSTLVTATVRGTPGDFAAASFHHDPMFNPVGASCGVLVVTPGFFQAIGVIDASGNATFSFTPPPFAAGFGDDIFLQLGVYPSGGGGLLLGGASVLTVHN